LESEKNQQEQPSEPPVTNEQIIPTNSTDENEKNDEEQEQTDDQSKISYIELKHPSSCKIRFSIFANSNLFIL
jgi:hypothetical protein